MDALIRIKNVKNLQLHNNIGVSRDRPVLDVDGIGSMAASQNRFSDAASPNLEELLASAKYAERAKYEAELSELKRSLQNKEKLAANGMKMAVWSFLTSKGYDDNSIIGLIVDWIKT
jgi:hypothetical protein